jgi:hypothetical protein
VTTNPLGTPAWRTRSARRGSGSRTWCDRGATVTWATLPAEHALGLVEGQAPAVAWLAARFAGAPAPGNCPLPG